MLGTLIATFFLLTLGFSFIVGFGEREAIVRGLWSSLYSRESLTGKEVFKNVTPIVFPSSFWQMAENHWRRFMTTREAPKIEEKKILRRLKNALRELNRKPGLGYEVTSFSNREILARIERKYKRLDRLSAWLRREDLSRLEVGRRLAVTVEDSTLSFSYFLPDAEVGKEESLKLEEEVDRIVVAAFYTNKGTKEVFQWVNKNVGQINRSWILLSMFRSFVVFSTIVFCFPVLTEFIFHVFNAPFSVASASIVTTAGLGSWGTRVSLTFNMDLWILHLSVVLMVFCAYLAGAYGINRRFLSMLVEAEKKIDKTPESFHDFLEKDLFRRLNISVRPWSSRQVLVVIVCPIVLIISALPIFDTFTRVVSLIFFVIGFYGLDSIAFSFKYEFASRPADKIDRNSLAYTMIVSFPVLAWSMLCFKGYIVSWVTQGDEMRNTLFGWFFAAFYFALMMMFLIYLIENADRTSFLKSVISLTIALTIAKIFVVPNPPILDVFTDPSGVASLVIILCNYFVFNMLPYLLVIILVAFAAVTLLSRIFLQPGDNLAEAARNHLQEELKSLREKTVDSLRNFVTKKAVEIFALILVFTIPSLSLYGGFITNLSGNLTFISIVVLLQLPLLFLIGARNYRLAKESQFLTSRFSRDSSERNEAFIRDASMGVVIFLLLLLTGWIYSQL